MVLILAALLLGAGCLPHRPAPPAPGPAVVESWACPHPPHRGLLRLEPDGRASLSVLEGLNGPGEGSSQRQKKQLSPADMKDLAAVLGKSGYRSFPEQAGSTPPRYEQSDPCSRSLEVSEGGETKRISYHDGDVPEELRRLLDAIDAVLDRTPWEPDVYPWEKR